MIKITFTQPDGSEKIVSAVTGHSLMEAARNASVEGIVAECNGSAACATCHVVLPKGVFDTLGNFDENEQDMLDFADAPRENCSRLSCQVTVTDEMDGIIVKIPSN